MLVEVPCCSCGVIFGLPRDLLFFRKRDGLTFHCPSGHGNSFLKVPNTGGVHDPQTELQLLKQEYEDIQSRYGALQARWEAIGGEAAEETLLGYALLQEEHSVSLNAILDSMEEWLEQQPENKKHSD